MVAQYLLQNALWWTESSGIDGFRIDTFPYVPRSFWSYYLKGLFDVYPNFFAVGEIFNIEPTVTSYWAGGHTGFDGVDTLLTTPFDFPMQNAINKVLNEGQSAKTLVNVLREDRRYPHPEILVTFIGTHDMPRVSTQAGGSRDKLEDALSVLARLRGIAQIDYGDESPWQREMTRRSPRLPRPLSRRPAKRVHPGGPHCRTAGGLCPPPLAAEVT